MHQILTYDVVTKDKKYYFNSLINIDSLLIPDNVKDEIESFGTVMQKNAYKETPGGLFCYRLNQLLSKHWKLSYGIPVIYFKGNIDNIGDNFKNRYITIFSIFGEFEKVDRIIDEYKRTISNFSKITFMAEPLELLNTFHIITTDHAEAYECMHTIKNVERQKIYSQAKYNFKIRMYNWYPDITYREGLLNMAKDLLDNFVYTKQLKVYIPEFIVVPAYNYSRYQKCLQLINQKHSPSFVMTLPMLYQHEWFTIMFPMKKGG